MKIDPTVIKVHEDVVNSLMYIRGMILNKDELAYIKDIKWCVELILQSNKT